MYTIYSNVKISAMAAAAPKKILDNEQFAIGIEDRRYRRRMQYTGIKQRHAVTGGQRASDLASIAAEEIFKKLNWEKDSIGVLIFITQSADLYAPSTAMLIQTKLGLGQNVMAFDVNLGCSGFTTGIQIMAGILQQTKGRGLLLMGDCQTYEEGTEFAADSILFGDGSAAVAMEYDVNAKQIPAFQMTDGSRFKAICSTFDKGHIMDGNEIVLFSLNEVVNSINEFYEHYCLKKENTDYFALHQAQKIIVDGIANNCGMQKEKVLEIYQNYGNTSSASIPFALCGNTDKINKEFIDVFACGFGIGLAWSGALINIKTESIIPLIESDYVYPNLF